MGAEAKTEWTIDVPKAEVKEKTKNHKHCHLDYLSQLQTSFPSLSLFLSRFHSVSFSPIFFLAPSLRKKSINLLNFLSI